MKKLFSLILFAFALVACAQPEVKFDSPAIWLEPLSSSMTALLADGTVLEISQEDSSVLASNFSGDTLTACNNQVLGVSQEGSLAYAGRLVSKLAVAPFHRPACLPNGNIVALNANADTLIKLDANLKKLSQTTLNALPDVDIVLTDLTGDGADEIIVLTDPSTRYTHGVLGDDIEAISVSVFNQELELISTYSLPEPFVFEQKRVTPFLNGESSGILATQASSRSGAGIILLGLINDELSAVAEAPAIGTGFRWLNLFASQNGFAYAIRTPHIGGPLQRYSQDGNKLTIESFQLGITNHAIGSRNLDLAVMLPSYNETHYFAFPSQHLNSIEIIQCTQNECNIQQSFPLEGRLSSNLNFTAKDDQITLYAADTAGTVYSFPIEP